MKYYLLRQDYKIGCHPKILGKVDVEKLWERNGAVYLPVAPYKDKRSFFALPFMDKPFFMISEELEELFSAYQAGGRSKAVALDDPEGRALFYYFYQPPIFDCLAAQAEYYPDHTIKKLILDRTKIDVNKIFQIAWLLEDYLIVDEEVLELMLCASIYPFLFEEVLVV